MTARRLDLADVFREYGTQFLDQYGSSLSIDQKCVFQDILACQTAVLGGHRYRCDQCAHELVLFNSCRNRHCPKCQAIDRARWMEARAAELLPTPYFHVVSTLPHDFGPIALQNKATVYGMFMRTVAETIKELAADPKHLGAEIGISIVLHTWGQKLDHHVHAHCICTGGGISPDGSRWVPCRRSKESGKDFFIHQQVLALKFRGKFIASFKRAYYRGELSFHGELARLNNASEFERFLDETVKKRWVTYAKRPFGNRPERVLKYLAGYTHRVAISNARLIEMRDGRVHFRYKDYRKGGQWKTTSLEGPEFIRRFLLHVLPNGFMKIRHYGFLANRFRKQKLALCQELLGASTALHHEDQDLSEQQAAECDVSPVDVDRRPRCPKCKNGRMRVIEAIAADALCGPFDQQIRLTPRPPPLPIPCEVAYPTGSLAI